MNAVRYQPRDELFLWWLGHPGQPALIGTLQMVRALRGVSLRYDDGWVRRGFALSGQGAVRTIFT